MIKNNLSLSISSLLFFIYNSCIYRWQISFPTYCSEVVPSQQRLLSMLLI